MAGLLDLSTLDPNFMASLLKGGAPPSAPANAAAAPTPQGGILDGLFAPKPDKQMGAADRWNILGATLRDIGDSLRGKDGKALATTEQAITSGGGSGSGAAKGNKKSPGQPTDTALLYQTAQNLFPGDPKAQFLFATGNSDFLKSLGESYGFHAVTGGDTVYGAPGQAGPTVASKLVDHDGQYGTQTANGYTGTGEAAPSYADQTGQQNAQTELQRLAETIRHNGVDEKQGAQRLGIEGGNLDLGRKRLGFDVRKDSSTRAPGAVYVQSQADIDALAPGTSFIAVHDPYGIVRHK
jgi:hypothetical protein